MNTTWSNVKAICAASLIGIAFVAVAQAMPKEGSEEVNKLISSVSSSECQFERNGIWYNGRDAASHLKTKFNATEKRLQTAEQFIQFVASSSSITKKPYKIRCGEKASDARVWLSQKLKELRSKK